MHVYIEFTSTVEIDPYMLPQETALQLPRSAFLLAADLTEQVCVCVCATMRVP